MTNSLIYPPFPPLPLSLVGKDLTPLFTKEIDPTIHGWYDREINNKQRYFQYRFGKLRCFYQPGFEGRPSYIYRFNEDNIRLNHCTWGASRSRYNFNLLWNGEKFAPPPNKEYSCQYYIDGRSYEYKEFIAHPLVIAHRAKESIQEKMNNLFGGNS